MKINKSFYEEKLDPENLPDWACPKCDTGILKTLGTIDIIKSAESSRNQKYDEWEPDWDTGVFFGKLVCQSAKCEETVIVSGNAGKEMVSFDQETGGACFDWYIEPKYFSHPVNLFLLAKEYPEIVNTILSDAFGLYWTDSSSCANKIRVAVEKILDNQKVPKYPKTGKRIPISLQKRIEYLRRINVDSAHYFEAVKWIGNVGSHNINELKKSDLISAFEMLHEALDVLYNPHSKKLKILAGQIIKRRGPIKYKKTKFGIR